MLHLLLYLRMNLPLALKLTWHFKNSETGKVRLITLMMGYAVSCNRISISRMSNGLLFTIALELFRYQYNNLNFEMSLPTRKPPAYWFICTDGFLDWHIVAFQAERTKVHGLRYMVHTTKLSQRLLSNKCQLQSIWRQLLSMYVCVGTGVCSANAGVCGWLYTHTHT